MDLTVIDNLDMGSVDDEFLQKEVKIIKDNLNNELLSVEDIASTIGFSRAQLHRKLKATINESAGQLVNEIRLNEAHRRLTNKTGTVSELPMPLDIPICLISLKVLRKSLVFCLVKCSPVHFVKIR